MNIGCSKYFLFNLNNSRNFLESRPEKLFLLCSPVIKNNIPEKENQYFIQYIYAFS